MMKSALRRPRSRATPPAAPQLPSPLWGVDEAGRGPWAGPVVAAAVFLPLNHTISGLADSKALTAARRDALFEQIRDQAIFGLGEASPAEIDALNILQATMLAMRRAISTLRVVARPSPAAIAIDGNRSPGLPDDWPATPDAPAMITIIKGDALVPSISAASILAKVTRDRAMDALDQALPQYGFAQHKGYGVPQHAEALRLHGPCFAHRRSFKPVRLALDSQRNQSANIR